MFKELIDKYINASVNANLMEKYDLGPEDDALISVLAERSRQDEMWGIQDHHPGDYYLILAEEVGELAQAIADDLVFDNRGTKHVREEAVQVAAVALAMVEAIDRKERSEQ